MLITYALISLPLEKSSFRKKCSLLIEISFEQLTKDFFLYKNKVELMVIHF